MKTYVITHDELADIVSKLIGRTTRDLRNMVVHQGEHPEHGRCITIQDACGADALLIRG